MNTHLKRDGEKRDIDENVRTHLKALAELYNIQFFAQLESNLYFAQLSNINFVKNKCQTFAKFCQLFADILRKFADIFLTFDEFFAEFCV